MTTFSISRPCDCHWKVVAICAASVGLINPGRNATRYFSDSVLLISIAVVSQASSHHKPVGVSTASKPLISAACASWEISQSAGRSPRMLLPCPPAMRSRESP